MPGHFFAGNNFVTLSCCVAAANRDGSGRFAVRGLTWFFQLLRLQLSDQTRRPFFEDPHAS